MRRPWFILLCACALPLTASAHVLDQYLQVAQIEIAPDGVRVNLRLTPGVQVADRIIAMIDTNHDGRISVEEERAYAQRVLGEVKLNVDGRPARLALTKVQFPSLPEMREGVGMIRFELAADAAPGNAGEHQLAFRNDHYPELSAYLANALVPTSETIKITGQKRDELQHGLQIDFRVTTADTSRAWPRLAVVLIIVICFALLLVGRKRLRVFGGARRLDLDH